MARKSSKRPEALPREHVLPDRAAECPHMALRPSWSTDTYVCEACHRELTTLEAEEVSSEASVRTLGAQA